MPLNNDGIVHLVVPCFNEAARLDSAAFERALRDMPWLALCFVNDGSTDDTRVLLEGIRGGCPSRVLVMSLPNNVGKAEAVRQGLLAVSEGDTICGFWDADLAAPLSELPALRALLTENTRFEWAWGIRVRTLGRHITRRAWRHYLGRVFATVASMALGVPSYDTQCGAKLFRASPLLRAVIAEPFDSRWIFDVELVSRAEALLRASGMPGVEQLVIEYPLSTWCHRGGSKVRSTDFLSALGELARIRAGRGRWFRPMTDWRSPGAEAGTH